MDSTSNCHHAPTLIHHAYQEQDKLKQVVPQLLYFTNWTNSTWQP